MSQASLSYWLIKSEPDVFSFADLQAVSSEPWNGVRNYQARNFLRQMRLGDICIFYHSNTKPPHAVGLAEVIREAYPDDLQFDATSQYFDPKSDPAAPRWSMVDVKALQALPSIVPLATIREMPQWNNSPLAQQRSRLSVLPVSAEQFEALLSWVGIA